MSLRTAVPGAWLLTVKEQCVIMLSGHVLVDDVGNEYSFDPSYAMPFRFRIRNVEGELCHATHPYRTMHDGYFTLKRV